MRSRTPNEPLYHYDQPVTLDKFCRRGKLTYLSGATHPAFTNAESVHGEFINCAAIALPSASGTDRGNGAARGCSRLARNIRRCRWSHFSEAPPTTGFAYIVDSFRQGPNDAGFACDGFAFDKHKQGFATPARPHMTAITA